jgi:hypothetical protein
MNRKQLIILIVLVVVVGGIGWHLFTRQNNSWTASNEKMGEKLFPNLSVNDVAQIQIKQSSGELNLEKTNDLWRVKERGDYPANFQQISGFLLKAADLKIAQTEEIGPSQLGRLELLDPSKGDGSGTSLQLKDSGGKVLKSAILGKKHTRKSAQPQFGDGEFPDGRYILLPNDTKEVVLISDPLSDIEAKPENWLDKDFFKVEKVKSVSLVSTNATNSWKLSRTNESTGAWVLADTKPGEQLDENKISGVANSVSSPSFVDVVVNAKPAETGLDKPTVVTFETFDGFTYTLNIGKNSGDNYYLTMKVDANLPKERVAGKDEKAEDKTKLDKEFADNHKRLEEKLKNEKAFEKWTYLVAKWTIEPLLRDRAQLMVEKKPAPATNSKTDIDPLGSDQ